MSYNELTIPEKIKVGLQNRRDCYNGKLGYVIPSDKDYSSWNSWRDKSIDPLYLDNTPVQGFILNKSVSRFETNNTYYRVLDSRGFEFEITSENLLLILENCDCTKGKGLEGYFVIAFNDKRIVLLPVQAQQYQNSLQNQEFQAQSIDKKDIKEGFIYKTKNKNHLIYLGKFACNEFNYPKNLKISSWKTEESDSSRSYKFFQKSSKYVFIDAKTQKDYMFLSTKKLTSIKQCVTHMARKPHPSLWHNLKDCAKKALLSFGRHVDSFVLVCQAQKQHETML